LILWLKYFLTFLEYIDKTGGEGTAAFISKAIVVYCGKWVFFAYCDAEFDLRFSAEYHWVS